MLGEHLRRGCFEGGYKALFICESSLTFVLVCHLFTSGVCGGLLDNLWQNMLTFKKFDGYSDQMLCCRYFSLVNNQNKPERRANFPFQGGHHFAVDMNKHLNLIYMFTYLLARRGIKESGAYLSCYYMPIFP